MSQEPGRGTAEWWDRRYQVGEIPWNTGIVPPEVRALVSSGLVPSGWALDLGCGTGLSSRYLAVHGFRVVGIDLAASALRHARQSAAAEGIPAWFCLGDVTELSFLNIRATLSIDVGCFHAVDVARRDHYVRSLAEHLLPGGFYLLYAFEPSPGISAEPAGISSYQIAAFAQWFNLAWAQHGHDRERRSAWYLMRRL